MSRLRISPLAAGGLLILICLNSACALWIARSMGGESPVEISPVAWAPEANVSLTDAAGMAIPPNAYPESLARPIFFRDRRPYVPPPPPPPAAPPPAPQAQIPPPVFVPPPPVTKPDLSVSGIALIGNAKQAYLGSGSNPDGAWVKEGEDIMGWRVDGITSVGVTISRAGQSFDLLLYPPMGQE